MTRNEVRSRVKEITVHRKFPRLALYVHLPHSFVPSSFGPSRPRSFPVPSVNSRLLSFLLRFTRLSFSSFIPWLALTSHTASVPSDRAEPGPEGDIRRREAVCEVGRDTRNMNQERGFFIDLMVGFLVFLMVSSGLSVSRSPFPSHLVRFHRAPGKGRRERGPDEMEPDEMGREREREVNGRH